MVTTPTSPATATIRMAQRGFVAMIGVTVVAVGVVLIVLPGPAILVVPLGLGILATEFGWARRVLARMRDGGRRGLRRMIPVEEP